MTLWGGRFDEPTSGDLKRLNDSFAFDRRMFAEDIRGSIVWAGALADAGVLTRDEADAIIGGLRAVEGEFRAGVFADAEDEDIHSAVERRLTALIGPVAGKLHTGRSRNDQVATDARLWTMAAIDRARAQIAALQAAVVEVARGHIETLMPGYTHVQPAQPITAAHWLLSFFWMWARDSERLLQARERAAVLPLGSGALAGTPFPVDREAMAAALGMRAISQNSLDAVSDRDFVAETLFALSLFAVHVSRLAEDVIWYSNPAFGFITLDDRYSTGSSLMPQKRNADPMELARGKAGRLIGHLTGLLTVLKGLPSTYNKDLQEDKEPLFDAFDTLDHLLPIVTATVRTLHLNPDAMRRALDDAMLATDLADYLVLRGVPFREAHHLAGRAVRAAEARGVSLAALTADEYAAISDRFGADVHTVYDFVVSVARRASAGGTAPAAVYAQLEQAEAWLARAHGHDAQAG
jgi:argininosuccinate lyase